MKLNLQGKTKKILTGAGVCLIAGVVAVTSMGMGPGGGGGPGGGRGGMDMEEVDNSVVVNTANPSLGTIVVTGEFVASVEPGQQVTVYPKLSGEVLAVHYNAGDTVSEGDVLLEIDATDLQYQVAQTQASLSTSQRQAQLNLEIAQQDLDNYQSGLSGGTNSSLISAEAAVRSAENNVQSAHSDLVAARRKWREAYNGDSSTDYEDDGLKQLKDAVSQAELTLEARQLTLEQAEESLRAVQKQVEEQAVSTANSVTMAEINGDLTSQTIALQKLQNDLNDARVKAPISGIIEHRYIDAYDMASTQTPVYVISNKDMMTISFNVTEATLGYMSTGDTIVVEKNGETAGGVITEISTMVDSSSGLYPVKASVEHASFDMHSGSKVKVYADTRKVENKLMVPIDSVYYESGQPYVYVVENNIANKTYIETGISDEENIQVVSGLTLEDEIIVTWSSNLMDGVEITRPGEERPAAAEEGEDAADLNTETDVVETADEAEDDADPTNADPEDAEEEKPETEDAEEETASATVQPAAAPQQVSTWQAPAVTEPQQQVEEEAAAVEEEQHTTAPQNDAAEVEEVPSLIMPVIDDSEAGEDEA